MKNLSWDFRCVTQRNATYICWSCSSLLSSNRHLPVPFTLNAMTVRVRKFYNDFSYGHCLSFLCYSAIIYVIICCTTVVTLNMLSREQLLVPDAWTTDLPFVQCVVAHLPGPLSCLLSSSGPDEDVAAGFRGLMQQRKWLGFYTLPGGFFAGAFCATLWSGTS
jgi:hypothetical protein